MPLDESLVSVLSLIITGVSVVLVPITVYLGLKQPIFLREAKKDLFLDFLSSYHKSARDTIDYIFGKKLNLKIIKISVFIGTVYYFLIIVTSLIWSSLVLIKTSIPNKFIKNILMYILSLYFISNYNTLIFFVVIFVTSIFSIVTSRLKGLDYKNYLSYKIIKGTSIFLIFVISAIIIWIISTNITMLSAKTSNIFNFSKLQAKYSELELSNINIIVIMIVYWSFHYLWVNMTEKDVKEDVRAKKIKEIRDSQLNVVVLTKYSRINGIIWDFFDKYLVLRDDTGFISIPWDEIVWIKAK